MNTWPGDMYSINITFEIGFDNNSLTVSLLSQQEMHFVPCRDNISVTLVIH